MVETGWPIYLNKSTGTLKKKKKAVNIELNMDFKNMDINPTDLDIFFI